MARRLEMRIFLDPIYFSRGAGLLLNGASRQVFARREIVNSTSSGRLQSSEGRTSFLGR